MTRHSSDENLDNFIGNWPHLRQRLIVFLGAGASVGAKNKGGLVLPNAFQLRNELWAKFKASSADFDPRELGLMSLQHASAIVEARAGRVQLSNYLVERFSCNHPLWPHLALPSLNPQCVFTTNYDQLIEMGFAQQGKVVDTIYNDRAPHPENQHVLYKPHGNLAQANQPIGQGGLVITQFDYLEMIADYRRMLERSMRNFHASCVLTIGYSFGDLDIGAELYRLRKANNGIPWYAVFPRNDVDVRNMYFQKLNIRQIDRTFESFMSELDDIVDFIPTEFKHSKLAELESAGRIQPSN